MIDFILQMLLRQCVQSAQELLTEEEDGEEAQATIQVCKIRAGGAGGAAGAEAPPLFC